MTPDPNPKELLPCPFCGGEAEVFGDDSVRWKLCRVICSECGANTGHWERTRAEAIAAWNRRTPEETGVHDPTTGEEWTPMVVNLCPSNVFALRIAADELEDQGFDALVKELRQMAASVSTGRTPDSELREALDRDDLDRLHGLAENAAQRWRTRWQQDEADFPQRQMEAYDRIASRLRSLLTDAGGGDEDCSVAPEVGDATA